MTSIDKVTATNITKNIEIIILIFLFKPDFRIVDRNDETDYIDITKGRGCYSHIGRIGGRQVLSLGDGCARNVGTPLHEFMHAIGRTSFN